MQALLTRVATVALAVAGLGGCAVYGPAGGDAYYGAPAYGDAAPGYYGYGAPGYYAPAPVYVGPPVTFGFSFGYWGGGHGHRGHRHRH